MIVILIFYWVFSFAFLAGYSYRQNNRLKFITCILLLIIAGLLYPFMLGMSEYEKRFKL
jgi:hypothetical protein